MAGEGVVKGGLCEHTPCLHICACIPRPPACMYLACAAVCLLMCQHGTQGLYVVCANATPAPEQQLLNLR